MSISFRCNNPDCQQSVNAPDGTEGRKARCSLCGTVQVIPSTSAVESPPTPGVLCGDCGIAMSPEAMLCSQCGWVNPSSFGTPPTPPPPTVRTSGSMEGECLKSLAYGFSNVGSLTKLVLYSIGLVLILGIIEGFFRWLIFFGTIGFAIVTLVSILTDLVISGFFFRFYLDCAISSLEGVNQAPDVPAFDLKTLFYTGLRGVGVIFVYLLPVITIPLLPLALLAWAYSDDLRMFDVRWAYRAAAKKPRQLGLLWGVMLLWGVVGIAALIVVWLLLVALSGVLLLGADSVFGQLLLTLLLLIIGGFLLSVVFHAFMAVQFRCVGMLGQYNPDLTDMLSETPTSAFPIGVLIGGIVLSVTLWGVILRGDIAKTMGPNPPDQTIYTVSEE